MNPENVAVQEQNLEHGKEFAKVEDAKHPLNRKPTEDFVYMKETHEALEIAFETNRNIILYGPGGYAKSEFTLAFLTEKNIDPFIITMGTGMTTDRLFGGMDIAKFNATGKIEYLVENSFMNHEYVIFEELFDAPDFILEQLKDILSRGVFVNGNQRFEIKTKVIFCCTNHDRESFAKNTSLRALMERFPLEHKVIWKDHTRITYQNLLTHKLGIEDPMLPYIFETYTKAGVQISPRIALVAADIFAQKGPSALNYIAEFSKKPDVLKEAITKFKSFEECNKLIQQLADMDKKKKDMGTLDTLDKIKEAKAIAVDMKKLSLKLNNIKADDSLIKMKTDAYNTYNKLADDINKELDILINLGSPA